MNHGGNPRAGVHSQAVATSQHVFEPAAFNGFGYFLDQPSKAQRSRLGDNPAQAQQFFAIG